MRAREKILMALNAIMLGGFGLSSCKNEASDVVVNIPPSNYPIQVLSLDWLSGETRGNEHAKTSRIWFSLNKAGFEGYNPTAEYHVGSSDTRPIEVGALKSEGYIVVNNETQYIYSAALVGEIQETGYVSFNVLKKTTDFDYVGSVEVKVFYAEAVGIKAEALDGEENRKGTTSVGISLDTSKLIRFSDSINVSVKLDGNDILINKNQSSHTINNRDASKSFLIEMKNEDLPEGYYFSDLSQNIKIVSAQKYNFSIEKDGTEGVKGTTKLTITPPEGIKFEFAVKVDDGVQSTFSTDEKIVDVENKLPSKTETEVFITLDDSSSESNGYVKETKSNFGIIPAQSAIKVEKNNGETGKVGTTEIKVSTVSGYNGDFPQITIEGKTETLAVAEKTFPIANKGSAGKSAVEITVDKAPVNGYYIPASLATYTINGFVQAVTVEEFPYHTVGGIDYKGYVISVGDKAVAYVFGTKPEMNVVGQNLELPSMEGTTVSNVTGFESYDEAGLETLATQLAGKWDAPAYESLIKDAIENLKSSVPFSKVNIISFDSIDSVIGVTFKFGDHGDKSPNGYYLKDITVLANSVERG